MSPWNSPLRIECPSCGGRVKIPAGGGGHRFRCPRCNAEITATGDIASPPPTETADDELFGEPPELPRNAVPPRVASSPPEYPPPVNQKAAFGPQAPPPNETVDSAKSSGHAGNPDAAFDTAMAHPVVSGKAAAEPVASEEALDQEFGLTCPLCGTFQYARRAQIGKAIRCQDCHTPIAVRPPQPRHRATPRPVADSAEDDGYRLSEPVERAQLKDVHEQILQSAEQRAAAEREAEGSVRKPVGDVIAQSARQVLGRARVEWEQATREAAERTARPLFQGLWSFLLDVDALARGTAMFLISLGLAVLARKFGQLIDGGPIEQFGAVAVAMLIGPLLLGYLATASACCLSIVQDTANGLEKIEQWPGLNFIDWAFDTFYVVNSLFLSAVPGVLLAQLPVMLGISGQWLAVLLGTVTALAGFPFLLLSALDTGSPVGVWSADVYRSFRRNRRLVVRFYLASAGLACGGLVSFAMLVPPWFLLQAAGAVGVNLAILVYSRLLGRLAGLLSADLAEPEEPPLDPTD